MPYRRTVGVAELLTGDALTAAMVGIGMRFAARAAEDANIEDTLFAASVEGLERDDLRVLAVLLTWLRIHHARVNADRLFRLVRGSDAPRVRAFWAAVGAWLDRDQKDHRFARFTALYLGPRLDLARADSDFQIRRFGEDERFAGAPLRVPANLLRDREADVLSPAELAKRHSTYRHRVLMGPTYRADMWAALEQDPSLSAAELARRAYGSFATAWHVKQDRELLSA
jgi:hypothetical protein